MKLIGLIRLGRDVEVRYTQEGTPVATLRAAWNFGRKGDDGERPTQWADLTLWGDRAEKLAEHLTKGKQLFVVCGDVNVRTFEKNDGSTGFNLTARVETLEFAGSASTKDEREERPASSQRRQAPPPSDDFDDDIPF